MLVAIADDQTDVRDALRVLIETETGLELAFEAARCDELFAALEVTCLDLLLIDWELPGLQEDDALESLRGKCEETYIVAMSASPEVRPNALEAGLNAFVCKGDPPEHLLALIHKACAWFAARR